MKQILIVVLIIFISGCFHKREIIETYNDGSLKIVKDYIDRYKYYQREYYVSGNLREEKVFVNGLQDSIQTFFGEDGNRRGEIHFREGLRNGMTYEIYRNGQIAFKGNCINGKFEGLSTWYYENGKVKESVYRHLGHDTGTMLRFDTAGILLKR
jgi:antitoxin component YwqK of YwqJK toxin-antitoxin module